MMHLLKIPSHRCHTYKTTPARRRTKKVSRIVPRVIPKIIPTTQPRPPVVTIPKGLPVSDTMWAYAQKQALKKRMIIPPGLQHNKALLIQWIDLLTSIRVK